MSAEIRVRRTSIYSSVQIQDGGATLDLGLLDKDERRYVAETFLNAAYELSENETEYQQKILEALMELTLEKTQ